ncbi:DegT/DnrJ/EryC1/StrS family aminotransferase [Tabrizicola sp. J26]|uniref:DegT/DnrJ/EryC1/StrS family aminotransferase n=1 Tax=Alitabrizicola rongguiensis TaxID=2909234 RepID=UPI001F38E9BF|nr:DegT/DnrJ/EryC1/StrS family aminotransferase [Tabrizicola rongguiensis]MCF1708570.1 DegT/DnrJ/EryC1/StrS family aminotransferase [Tabrizicola rongguiensis]
MIVPFLDVRASYASLKPEIDAAVLRVLDSGWYILGAEVEAFEAEFAAYCEARHCVGVASGLDALVLSLRASGIGPGDEVIVPSNTFIATWLAVSQVGATIVPVEPDPKTHTIDPRRVEDALTSKTRAIIPVHLYGVPADLDPLLEIAKRHGLRVIEDAAQAHGARYGGRRIGAHGDIVCWSFYPGKNLGAFGDGGAITTDDADLAAQVRLLGNYGSRQKYKNEVQGYNSRLDPIHAAALRVKLTHLDAWNDRRRAIQARYTAELPADLMKVQRVSQVMEPVWHLSVVRCAHREKVQAALTARGIATLIHYPIPPHRQDAYAMLAKEEGSYPIAEELARQVLSLPMGPAMSDEMQDAVIAAVNEIAAAGL